MVELITIKMKADLIIITIGILFTLVRANVRGLPDDREMEMFVSRGSGTGPVLFWYGLLAVLALLFFIAVMMVILCYKRERGIRGTERTLFLTPY